MKTKLKKGGAGDVWNPEGLIGVPHQKLYYGVFNNK